MGNFVCVAMAATSALGWTRRLGGRSSRLITFGLLLSMTSLQNVDGLAEAFVA